jgi:hypothetical protein
MARFAPLVGTAHPNVEDSDAAIRRAADAGATVKMPAEDMFSGARRSVLDALEARHPTLRGTIREQVTKKRRSLMRIFACGADLSHHPPDAPFPEAVATGAEPLLIVGAIAGG